MTVGENIENFSDTFNENFNNDFNDNFDIGFNNNLNNGFNDDILVTGEQTINNDIPAANALAN